MTATPITEIAAPAAASHRVRAARALVAAVLALASVLTLLVSAALFAEVRFLRWIDFFPAVGAAALWLIAGGLLLGAALGLSPWRLPFMQPRRDAAAIRIPWVLLGLGLILLGLGTVFGGRLIEAWPIVS
ncbi:MAG TPA: hypothetical protein VER79_01425, partial [Candidatus Limnocylindrales bacterium]|nr:hypothetical protein [Candidatus Limnocylindrales bacterium]